MPFAESRGVRKLGLACGWRDSRVLQVGMTVTREQWIHVKGALDGDATDGLKISMHRRARRSPA